MDSPTDIDCLSFQTNSYIFYDCSRQKLTGWHNTVFTSLQGPEEVIKRAARVHRHHGPWNYAAVVANDLNRYQLFGHTYVFRSTTGQNMIAPPLDHALCCKECSPWEETLKFEWKSMRAMMINCEFSLPHLTASFSSKLTSSILWSCTLQSH